MRIKIPKRWSIKQTEEEMKELRKMFNKVYLKGGRGHTYIIAKRQKLDS